jgi:chorismate mutase
MEMDWAPAGGLLIISGPCSAETCDQVMDTARQIADTGRVTVFRAGVWKPRTRPGGFEGAGVRALDWLNRVQKETGLKVMVEVATRDHVAHCRRAGIDMVWIGARTTSNPFSVHEIACALKGADIPVLVKNPLNPDLNLWVGAIERLYNAGIRQVGAIHRGFFPVEKTPYRNIPKWEIAIELKSIFRKMPVICDPSHMAGDADLVFDLAQKALDLNMDGLMIESHRDPAAALSDAAQQVTPARLNQILMQLTRRKPSTDDPGFQDMLTEIRTRIDAIDHQLLVLLSRRFALSEKIGREKRHKNIAVLQLNRWEQMKKERLAAAAELGLPDRFVSDLLTLVHKQSIAVQTQIMKQDRPGAG